MSNARRDASILAALREWHSRLTLNGDVTDESELRITFGELDVLLGKAYELDTLKSNLVKLPDDSVARSTD